MDFTNNRTQKKNEAPDYLEWLSVFVPNDKAPKWKKLNFIVDTQLLEKTINLVKSKGTQDGKVRFNLCESTKGNLYVAYDTFHRDREKETKVKAADHSPDREETAFLNQ